MQNALARFDELSNVQTASFLLVLLVAMTGTAVCLLVAAVALVPAPSVAEASPPAVIDAPVRIAPTVERSEPPVQRAVTVASTVHLRAEPTTSAQSLAILPRDTELELLDTAGGELAVWRNVRTRDGREGWIIATALDPVTV
jgi:Bacterial SH3 domain